MCRPMSGLCGCCFLILSKRTESDICCECVNVLFFIEEDDDDDDTEEEEGVVVEEAISEGNEGKLVSEVEVDIDDEDDDDMSGRMRDENKYPTSG